MPQRNSALEPMPAGSRASGHITNRILRSQTRSSHRSRTAALRAGLCPAGPLSGRAELAHLLAMAGGAVTGGRHLQLLTDGRCRIAREWQGPPDLQEAASGHTR